MYKIRISSPSIYLPTPIEMEREGSKKKRRRGIANGEEGEEREIGERYTDMEREGEERTRDNECHKRGTTERRGRKEGKRENERR